MSFNKNDRIRIARRLDMTATGGPDIPAGTSATVLIVRRDGRLWVDIDGFDQRHIYKEDAVAFPTPKQIENSILNQLSTDESFHLDDLVYDAASNEASEVNNDGIGSQVAYLVKHYGPSAAEVVSNALGRKINGL